MPPLKAGLFAPHPKRRPTRRHQLEDCPDYFDAPRPRLVHPRFDFTRELLAQIGAWARRHLTPDT
jgi:hypothetical protein